MFINSAFAYTHSNYIDSYVHDALIGQPTITTKKGIAGVAWEYLQAVHRNGGAKSLIITKGARIAKNNFPGDSEKTPKFDYLQTFASSIATPRNLVYYLELNRVNPCNWNWI
jgi:hypothetical protein